MKLPSELECASEKIRETLEVLYEPTSVVELRVKVRASAP